MASTAVSPRVNTTDCPAFKVADTRSVATDAFCRRMVEIDEQGVCQADEQGADVSKQCSIYRVGNRNHHCARGITVDKQATLLTCADRVLQGLAAVPCHQPSTAYADLVGPILYCSKLRIVYCRCVQHRMSKGQSCFGVFVYLLHIYLGITMTRQQHGKQNRCAADTVPMTAFCNGNEGAKEVQQITLHAH